MNTTETNKKSVHQGRNAKRFREARLIKQEVIAQELNISQQAVSQIEKRQELEDDIIEVYARVLDVDEFFIRNLADDPSNGANNFFDNSSQIYSHTFNFNPLDKLIELCSEKDKLYERMLQEKEKVNRLLENFLDKFTKTADE